MKTPIALAVALAIVAPNIAHPDAFTALAESYHTCEHNDALWGAKINIEGNSLTHEQMPDVWKKSTYYCSEPAELTSQPQWFGNMGVATMRTIDPDRHELTDAYLVLRVDEQERITGYWWGRLDRWVWRYGPHIAQAGDVASTAAGLASGMVEANPIMGEVLDAGGIPLMTIVKIAVPEIIARSTELDTCLTANHGLALGGIGLTVYNGFALATSATGAGIVLGAAAMLWGNEWAHESAEVDCLEHAGVKLIATITP